MKTNSYLPNNVFVFSREPLVTEPMVRSFLSRLKQKDDSAKEKIIDFIYHRLNRRYIQPLLHVQDGYRSGFLIMAASCLLIEALQSFHEGRNNTSRGSQDAFKAFFKREESFFPRVRECFPLVDGVNQKGEKIQNCTFYKNVRCGILHQAETTGGYTILRNDSALFEKRGKSINADTFLKAVESCLERYIHELRATESSTHLWKMAVKKVGHICDNCQN